MKKNIKKVILFIFVFMLFFCENMVKCNAEIIKEVENLYEEKSEYVCRPIGGSAIVGETIYLDPVIMIHKDENGKENLGCYVNIIYPGEYYAKTYQESCNLELEEYKSIYANPNKGCSYIQYEPGTGLIYQIPEDGNGNSACNKINNGLKAEYKTAKKNLENCGGDCTKAQEKYDDVLSEVTAQFDIMMKDTDFDNKEDCMIWASDVLNNNFGGGFTSDDGGCGILSTDLSNWLLNILKLIRYAGPALLIIMSIMDFIKAIASSKDEEIKKATNRFMKRLIAIVLLFIFPLLIEFILKVFDVVSTDPFCGLF